MSPCSQTDSLGELPLALVWPGFVTDERKEPLTFTQSSQGNSRNGVRSLSKAKMHPFVQEISLSVTETSNYYYFFFCISQYRILAWCLTSGPFGDPSAA